MFCSQCGIENPSEARFCHHCGTALLTNTAQTIVSARPQAPQPIGQSKKFLGGSYHPWRRLFAKSVDFPTLGLPAFLILILGVHTFFPGKEAAFIKALENPIVAGIVLFTLWILLEAILLSTVGNTPARWLFGISVKTSNGGKLSFQQALRRSSLAALQGMGLGIPFVAIVTHIFAYRRLTKTGTTLWDTAANSVVTHKDWGVGRAILCVVSVFFVLVLISLLVAAGK